MGGSFNEKVYIRYINKEEWVFSYFIGFSISKIYLIGYPSWGELLEELWNKTKNTNFFGHLNKVRDKFKKDGVIYEGKLDF